MTNGEPFLNQIHDLIDTYFNLEELRTLCFELNVDYDSLGGEGKSARARELILYLAHREQLDNLLTLVRRERPQVNWPPVPADLQLPASARGGMGQADLSSLQIDTGGGDFIVGGKTVGGDLVHGDKIMGDKISGDKINVGDISGSGIAIGRGASATASQGDTIEMSGDFRGALVNVNSRLEGVKQTIAALPHGDEASRQALISLVEELKGQLAAVPAERVDDAERISRRAEAMALEMSEGQPDREMVTITGEGLKRAAQNIADVLPTVIAIATRIVSAALAVVP